MYALGAETGIVGGDDDINFAQHVLQISDQTRPIRIGRWRAIRRDARSVGRAHAMTWRPPAGAGPDEMKIAPETGIDLSFGSVER